MRKMGLLDLCSNQSECPKDSVETVSSRRMFIPVWWSLGKRRRRKDSDGEPSQGGHRGPDSFHNHMRPRNSPSPDPQITVTSAISFRLFLSFQVLLGSSAHMLLISPLFKAPCCISSQKASYSLLLNSRGRKLQRSAGLLL